MSELRRLGGKVVIVTGAGGAIGAATCLRLAAEGATVVASDVREAPAGQTVADVEGAGGTAVAFVADVTVEESVADLVAFAVQTWGRLDGLHNNAATIFPAAAGQDSDAVDLSLDVWARTLDVNLTGYLYGVRFAVPAMLGTGGGAIVNTSSDAAWTGESWGVAYAVSKAGILALTRHVAARWGSEGIRCNAITPGFVQTPFATGFQGENVARFRAATPSHRLGVPADVAAMVATLMSADGEWINGQSYAVNGGGVRAPYSATMR